MHCNRLQHGQVTLSLVLVTESAVLTRAIELPVPGTPAMPWENGTESLQAGSLTNWQWTLQVCAIQQNFVVLMQLGQLEMLALL